MQPFYRQLAVVLTLYFSMVLVATPLVYWLAKRIKLPVEYLTRGAHHIQQGDYNYVIPRDHFDKDPLELKLLCETFNQMTIDIKDNMEALNATNEKLQHVSQHDALTGLCNRACFDSALRRSGKGDYVPAGIIVCDVDGLKIINDTLGHQVGDELIRATARVLKKGVRESDEVARIGGDEFAILLPGAGKDRLEAVCSRIKEAMNLHNKERPDLPLYLSLGYAVQHALNFNTDKFFREADDNMYREKGTQRQAVREKIYEAIKTIQSTDEKISSGI